jgi:WD40 repeat protein
VSTESELSACHVDDVVVPQLASVDLTPDSAEGIRSIDATPEGRLVAGTADGSVHLLEAAALSEGKVGDQEVSDVFAVRWLSDGRVASGGEGVDVTVWHPDDPAVRPVGFRRLTNTVDDIEQLSDGRLLVSSFAYEGWVWDPDNSGDAYRLGDARLIAVSANGRVATASSDGAVTIWEPDLTNPVVRRPHQQPVGALAWLGEDRLVSSGEGTGIVKVWRPDEPDEEAVVFDGHQTSTFEDREVLDVASLGNGAVVSAGRDGVRVWCPDQEPVENVFFAGEGARVVAVLDDRRIVHGDWNGTVFLWQLPGVEPDSAIGPGRDAEVDPTP